MKADLARDYTFVRTCKANIHLLAELYTEVTGRRVTAKEMERKYTTRWTADGNFYGFMALDANGKAVSHHGSIPVLVSLGGKEYKASQSCDTLTAERARGKGLIGQVDKLTLDLLRKDGFDFLFGFSNQNSIGPFVKSGRYVQIPALNGYKIAVNTLPLEKICRRLKFLHRPYLALVDFAFRRKRISTPIPNSCIEGLSGGVVRNEDFYALHSNSFNRRVKVGAVGVWFKLEGPFCIGEIEKKSESEIMEMMRIIRKKCFWLGIREIVFQASPGSFHDQIFSRHFPPFLSWVPLASPLCSNPQLEQLRFTFGDIESF